ncbi:sulfotransferase family protein [Halovulum sp. GXIMD14793]
MALEIIGPGFGRTGTNSLKLALEQLGFGPCHHMYEINPDAPDQVAYWEAISKGETPDWDQVFAGFRSQLDWPGCHFWRDLLMHYSNAKVVMSVRDAQGWLKSFKSTIFPYLNSTATQEDPLRQRKTEMTRRIIRDQAFGGDLSDDNLLRVFNRHITEVQHTVPPDRLLTFDVRQGWEPLCTFLSVQVPDTPFPRTNTTAEFRDRTSVPLDN